MHKKIAIFWPGDYRNLPNQAAIPEITKATVQLENALKKLGHKPYRVPGFITKPHEAIAKLSKINDPIIGVYVHWVYGPHTTEGVVGKDNPLLLVSNFSGIWPGLVGLLNTAACLEMVNRPCSRIWTDADNWLKDRRFMSCLNEWCKKGTIKYGNSEITTRISSLSIPPKAQKIADILAQEIQQRRILALMLGDTSMGMINGYFGPRLLNQHGFSEHKIDQAWLIDRGRNIKKERIEKAFAFVKKHWVTFHYCQDFNEQATKEQLRDYLVVLDLVKEFNADCLGWQYQLGLINLRPPSDFAEGLLNSVCRPESNNDTIVTSTEADQGNLIPMELMKRILKAKKLPQCTMFHDIRWGSKYDGRFLWVLLNSGSSSA